MAKVLVDCLEFGCPHYRQYYLPRKYKGGYVPNFEAAAQGLVERRCWHPKVFTPTGKVGVDLGVAVCALKKCPNVT